MGRSRSSTSRRRSTRIGVDPQKTDPEEATSGDEGGRDLAGVPLEHYTAGQLPWDTGVPDEPLVFAVGKGIIAPGRALEIGCGTGTNALWLAQRGFDVVALDAAW